MFNVIVLAGGTSPEKDVSKRSGDSVLNALQIAGYNAKLVDPALGLETLLPQLKQADVVFPALHGAGGEDGTLQKFLEDQNINFVGSGSVTSALCFDKAEYSRALAKHNIQQPKTEIVDKESFGNSALRQQPFVLKPKTGGSSIDTFVVRDLSAVPDQAIKEVFDHYETLLLQEVIIGTEITVAVLGEETLPVIEIIPPTNEEFDYENKYNGATQEICPPEHVSDNLQKQAQDLALSIHKLAGCLDMSRTDIIITPQDKLYVLETNTIPGLTNQSLLPKAAAEAGYDMPKLVTKLVEAARLRS